jgi:REP element-mobilizing transposase RayT
MAEHPTHPLSSRHAHLPRLTPEFYRGFAVVHWVMTVDRRATGWLDPLRHAQFREALIHTLVRYEMLCPAYCLMPDHAHFVWMGIASTTDQRLAAAFFRRATNRLLAPEKWQQEPYDGVLRDEQRKRGAFQSVCAYVRENPVRAGLVVTANDYAYSGAIVPAFPDLEPCRDDFWNVFWSVYNAKVERARSAP